MDVIGLPPWFARPSMVVAMLMAILLGLIFGCWVKPPNPELTLVGGGLVLLLFIDSAGNTDVPRCHEPLVRVVALGGRVGWSGVLRSEA